MFVHIAQLTNSLQLKQCREYQALREALRAGGLPDESLDILIAPASHNTMHPPPGLWHDDKASSYIGTSKWMKMSNEPQPFPSTAPPSTGPRATSRTTFYGDLRRDSAVAPQVLLSQDEAFEDDMISICTETPEDYDHGWCEQQQQPRKGPRQDHTLLLSPLPDGTSHKEITNIVRGGRLLQIWIRTKERSACVTFAEGAAAFLAYSKRNPPTIRGKIIDVSWSDWQFTPRSGLVNKLAVGSTAPTRKP